MAESIAAIFLRRGSRILLVEQPLDRVSDEERWGVPMVTMVDEEPVRRAATRWLESIAMSDTSEVIRIGPVHEMTLETEHFEVTPVLVETSSDELTVSDHGRHSWGQPPEILTRSTLPSLWRLYESVGPSIRSVSSDTTHGSTYLSLRALEVLRDRAAWLKRKGEAGEAELADLARELRSARPDMVVLKVRIAKVMHDDPAAERVLSRTTTLIDDAEDADRHAADVVAKEIGQGGTVFIFSRSETVLTALERVSPDRIITTVATPGEEGVDVASVLADQYSVTLAPDAAIADVLSESVDAVLLGADGVDAEGSVTNKLGTYTVAIVAAALDIPVYVVTATAKLCDIEGGPTERVSPGSIYGGSAPVDVHTSRFDRTPSRLITGYCTERGRLTLDEVREVATAHGELLGESY